MLFRKVLPYILALFGVLLDVSILPQLVVDPKLPIFSFCVVVALGMVLGRARGALVGLFSGLFIDVTVGNPVGLVISLCILAGYLSGFVRSIKKGRSLVHLIIPVVCVAMYELTMLLYQYVNTGAFYFGDMFSGTFRIAADVILIHLLYLLFAAILRPKHST